MTASLFARYQAGERAEVWDELRALGERYDAPPYREDAEAVARETMTRARRNVELLIDRLHALDYQFAFPDEIWTPPNAESDRALGELISRYGPVPLSIRMWHEVVGAVDFRGDHPTLAFYHRVYPESADRFWSLHWYSDPLVIESVTIADILEWDPEWEEKDAWLEQFTGRYIPEDRLPVAYLFAPDAICKSYTSGGPSLEISLPDHVADVLLDSSDWPGVPFVSYLRKLFRFGGFPGLGHRFPWSTHDPDPSIALDELAFLTRDLAPI